MPQKWQRKTRLQDPIGLNAEDPQVRENAERARENLLRNGRFDFLGIQ
jgi:hypothetical protein